MPKQLWVNVSGFMRSGGMQGEFIGSFWMAESSIWGKIRIEILKSGKL